MIQIHLDSRDRSLLLHSAGLSPETRDLIPAIPDTASTASFTREQAESAVKALDSFVVSSPSFTQMAIDLRDELSRLVRAQA